MYGGLYNFMYKSKFKEEESLDKIEVDTDTLEVNHFYHVRVYGVSFLKKVKAGDYKIEILLRDDSKPKSTYNTLCAFYKLKSKVDVFTKPIATHYLSSIYKLYAKDMIKDRNGIELIGEVDNTGKPI